jgi:hypothetical protein
MPFSQSDNPFIRLPTRAMISIWSVIIEIWSAIIELVQTAASGITVKFVIMIILLFLGGALVYLAVRDEFNLLYFFGACAMFLFVSAIRRRLGKQPIDKQDLAK